MRILFIVFFVGIITVTIGQPIPVGSELKIGSVPAHDPVMIKQNDVYYLFCTGNGITVWSSADMQTWKKQKPVFDTPPEWAVKAVPGYKGHIWAPEITFING